MQSYDPAGLLANGRSLMVRRIKLGLGRESEAVQAGRLHAFASDRPCNRRTVRRRFVSADCRDSQ